MSAETDTLEHEISDLKKTLGAKEDELVRTQNTDSANEHVVTEEPCTS